MDTTKRAASIVRKMEAAALQLAMPRRYQTGAHLRPEQIKRMRKALGLTQPQLAEALGTTRQTVSNWERGVKVLFRIEPDEISRIRAALGLSQKELAAYLRCKHSQVKSWERGRSQPRGTDRQMLGRLRDRVL